ncbi:MAG: DNA methyltransferase [Candidatus Bathyarchaeia archaeon]
MREALQSALLIRYWGRKAGDIAEPYIKGYSKINDVVLDPFGGAGSIVKTALSLNRKAIYVDANPFAALIAKVEIEGVDANELTRATNILLNTQHFSDFYQVQCKCGLKATVLYYLWENGEVKAAKVKCKCGNSWVNTVNKTSLIPSCENNFPKVEFKYKNGRPFLKRRQVNYVHQLFSPRNLLILSSLYEKIKNIQVTPRTKRGLYVAFASILYQASRMSRLNSGSWGINSYWIPRIHVERNPLQLFKNAVHRLERIKPLALAVNKAEAVINGKEKIAILNEDAREMPIPDNSVDLIITDPPFTDEVQYFELSFMAASWLRLPMPFEKEIIINPNQGKTANVYYSSLYKAFLEMHRTLKKNGIAVIMLHDENPAIISNLTELVENTGFRCVKKEKRQMMQRHVGDRDRLRGKDLFILTCKKL